MIRFALTCDHGHDFEAWFSSGAALRSKRVPKPSPVRVAAAPT
jgi:hypothetical protein